MPLDTLPPVYLNHLLVFVDRTTYREIAQSAFLRDELAWAEERTTVDQENNAAWTGCYFYGMDTYFEFMDPDATTWKPRDGIAFGVDEPGAGRGIRERLAEHLGVDVRQYLRSRQYDDQAVPWFEMIEYDRPDDVQMISWVMAYHPDFLKQWALDLPPAAGGVARGDVLRRYRARIGEFPQSSSRFFKDIIEIVVALPYHEMEIFLREMNAFGYLIRETEGCFKCVGPGITITIKPGTPPYTGIHAFTLALNRPKGGQREYRFGAQCVLVFHDDQTAEWRLWS